MSYCKPSRRRRLPASSVVTAVAADLVLEKEDSKEERVEVGGEEVEVDGGGTRRLHHDRHQRVEEEQADGEASQGQPCQHHALEGEASQGQPCQHTTHWRVRPARGSPADTPHIGQ